MTNNCLFPILYADVLPKSKNPVVEQVFLIHQDGRLISYASFEKYEHFDEDIVGGMLTAVMNYILYAFGKIEERTDISEYKFGFGGRRLILETGEHLFIAIVVLGMENKSLLAKTKDIVRDIEKRYESAFGNWRGDLDDFAGVDELILTLLPHEGLSEEERMAIQKEGIREKVFEIWSSKYLPLLQKGLMPKTHLWNNLRLDLNSDLKKGPIRELKGEGSSDHKNND
jgi:hypothetical protein